MGLLKNQNEVITLLRPTPATKLELAERLRLSLDNLNAVLDSLKARLAYCRTTQTYRVTNYTEPTDQDEGFTLTPPLRATTTSSHQTRNYHSDHRVTHCWHCKTHLDGSRHHNCRRCGWIECSCGACGCG